MTCLLGQETSSELAGGPASAFGWKQPPPTVSVAQWKGCLSLWVAQWPPLVTNPSSAEGRVTGLGSEICAISAEAGGRWWRGRWPCGRKPLCGCVCAMALATFPAYTKGQMAPTFDFLSAPLLSCLNISWRSGWCSPNVELRSKWPETQLLDQDCTQGLSVRPSLPSLYPCSFGQLGTVFGSQHTRSFKKSLFFAQCS